MQTCNFVYLLSHKFYVICKFNRNDPGKINPRFLYREGISLNFNNSYKLAEWNNISIASKQFKMKSTFVILLIVSICVSSIFTVPVSDDDLEVLPDFGGLIRERRGFFCNVALCSRDCKLQGRRRGACNGDECVCI